MRPAQRCRRIHPLHVRRLLLPRLRPFLELLSQVDVVPANVCDTEMNATSFVIGSLAILASVAAPRAAEQGPRESATSATSVQSAGSKRDLQTIVDVRRLINEPLLQIENLRLESPPANAPQPSGRLQFHVQPIAGGLVSTAAARRLSQGDTVKLAAPVGEQLTLPENGRAPDLLMVAGGTGLAPLRAVLEQIDRGWEATRSAPQVHLFHGSRTSWNLYDHDYLTRLATKPWFTYTPVVSEDPAYRGSRGLVGTVAATADDWSGRTAMVCGSPGMVRHTVQELRAAGLSPASIRREQFDFLQGTELDDTIEIPVVAEGRSE